MNMTPLTPLATALTLALTLTGCAPKGGTHGGVVEVPGGTCKAAPVAGSNENSGGNSRTGAPAAAGRRRACISLPISAGLSKGETFWPSALRCMLHAPSSSTYQTPEGTAQSPEVLRSMYFL